MKVQRYRQSAKVVTHAAPVFSRLLWGSLIASIGIATALLIPQHARAAINSGAESPLQHKAIKVSSVGYQQAWVNEQSRIAYQAFEKDNYHLARRVWTALAQSGNSDAAYRLGMLYDTGTGVARDSILATAWYMRAAKAGNLDAQHNLAVAYVNGDGIGMDISKAIYWWKQAAQRGNADSQYNLGIVYAMGVHGIKRNLDDAKKWWRKAAIKGDPMAQYNLGTIYANGDGHIKSYCEATRWWEKSARKGIEQASWALHLIKQRDDYKACW